MICAVCQLSDDLVINIIVASPSDLASDGCQLIEITEDQLCSIGSYWNGSTFDPPIEKVV